ncbi:MAG: prepilin peptidase [Burkholderiaceae bacterium]|nr:prepilin peptidase [Burkholderiaceae bacterium]
MLGVFPTLWCSLACWARWRGTDLPRLVPVCSDLRGRVRSVCRPQVPALAAFAGFLLLHWMRVMGAGDVKLMTMLGAVFGLHLLALLVLLVFLAGAVLVAARLIDGGRRKATVANLRLLLCGVRATLDSRSRLRFDPRVDTADRLPFGLAIAAGATSLALMQLSGAVT